MAKICVLEDEPVQADLLSGYLIEDGHDVSVFATGATYLEALRKQNYDLLIVDWHLPDTTGIEVLAEVRGELLLQTPVLFVTNRGDSEDIASALNAGADDYMIKEVDRTVLLARVGALLRRHPAVDASLELGLFTLDPVARELRRNEDLVDLTAKDFDLAYYLFKNFGRLLSRKQLLEDVWGISAEINTRTVDVHVSRLRKRLRIDPETGLRIRTIYNHGYRLERHSE